MPLSRYSLGELESANFRQGEPLVRGLLTTGQNVLLVAPPKHMKSIFSLVLGLSVAAGVNVAETWQVPAARSVVYVALERPEYWWQARIRRIRESMGAPDTLPFTFFHGSHLYLNTQESRDELASIVDELRPALLIVDPLYRANRGTLTDDEQVQLTTEALSTLRDYNNHCTLVNHHTHRSRRDYTGAKVEEGSDAYFGSVFITAWMESYITVNLNKKSKSLKVVRHESSDYDFEEEPEEVVLDIGDDTPERLSFVPSLEERMRRRTDLAGLNMNEIARALGVHHQKVKRVLTPLIKSGKVVMSRSGGRVVLAGFSGDESDNENE